MHGEHRRSHRQALQVAVSGPGGSFDCENPGPGIEQRSIKWGTQANPRRQAPVDKVSRQPLCIKMPALVIPTAAYAHGELPKGEGGLDEAPSAKEVRPGHPISCHCVLEVGVQQSSNWVHGAEVAPGCKNVRLCHCMRPKPAPHKRHIRSWMSGPVGGCLALCQVAVNCRRHAGCEQLPERLDHGLRLHKHRKAFHAYRSLSPHPRVSHQMILLTVHCRHTPAEASWPLPFLRTPAIWAGGQCAAAASGMMLNCG